MGALMDSDSVIDPATGRPRRDEDLKPWIDNMKSWMRQSTMETDRLLNESMSEEDAYLASE